MSETVQVNQKCYIGNPNCGYAFSSAKMCFVAAPADDRYNIKISLIKSIIESFQYECYVALKRIDPGKFAFCTKICSKIIQSQFCIVLLDYSLSKEKGEFPNPNVHLEYGMMLTQNKYIIPMQHEDYSLSFNIAPLDTIKYNEITFESKLREAIGNAIISTDKGKALQQYQEPNFYIYYSLKGYTYCDTSIKFYELLFNHGKYLGFGLVDGGNKYKFTGQVMEKDPKSAILNTKILLTNLINSYDSLIKSTPPQDHSKYEYMKNDISVDLIIDNNLDKVHFEKILLDTLKTKYRYEIFVFTKDEIANIVKSEYDKIEDIRKRV